MKCCKHQRITVSVQRTNSPKIADEDVRVRDETAEAEGRKRCYRELRITISALAKCVRSQTMLIGWTYQIMITSKLSPNKIKDNQESLKNVRRLILTLHSVLLMLALI